MNGNGAPSRKGCVVNGQMTKASNKRVRPPLKPQRRYCQGFSRVVTRPVGPVKRKYHGSSRIGSGNARTLTDRNGAG